MSKDLRNDFPAVTGFSKRNLELVRQWSLFYSNCFENIAKQVASQMEVHENEITKQLVSETEPVDFDVFISEFHCLDIEFPDVDFSSYYIKGKTEIEKIHHAHLYANKDEIELKIFFDDQTYFGEKLTTWARNIAWKKFGSFIKVEVTKNHTNERLQKVDLSEAKLLGSTNSTNYTN